MLFAIYCIIIALNAFCLLCNYKSKVVQLLSFTFLLILMAGNTYNNDYWAYSAEYINGNDAYFSTEYGLKAIFWVGNLLGLSYQAFLFVVYACCLATHAFLALKMKANLHVYLCLYLVFGFITDTVVVRNFIALTFLTVALYMLYRRKRIYSFLFMAVAVLFHKTMLFYAPLLLINFRSKLTQKLFRIVAGGVLGICFIAFLAGSRFEFVGEFIATYIMKTDKNHYLSTSTNYGFIAYFGVQLVSTLSIFLASKLIERKTEDEADHQKTRDFLNFCLLLNLYVILSFPLLMMSVAMHRLFRNIFVLNLIALGTVAASYRNKIATRKYGKLLVIILAFCLVWRVLYFFEMPHEFNQILSNNILFW